MARKEANSAGVILVPFDSIKLGTNHSRQFVTGIDALARSIELSGHLAPLIVFKARTGYVLVAGYRRHKALQVLRKAKPKAWDMVPVQVRDEEQALIDNAVENVARADLKPIEFASVVSKMADQGMKTKEIAERLGKSDKTIYAALSVMKVHPEILDAMKAGTPIGWDQLNVWKGLSHAEQLLKFKEWQGHRTEKRKRASNGTVEKDDTIDKFIAELKEGGHTLAYQSAKYVMGIGKRPKL